MSRPRDFIGLVDLTNREIAVVAWLLAFSLWALLLPGVRASLWSALRIAAGPKLAIPLLLFLLYFGAVVAVGAAVGIWNASLVKDTIAWFVVAGFVMFGRFPKVGQPRFIRNTLLATIAVPELIQFFLGTVSFPLFAELVIVPIAALLAGMSVVVRMPEQRAAKPVVDGMTATFGLGLLAGTLVLLFTGWSSLDHQHLLVAFYLPIWLTAALIPFVLALGVISAYEQTFITLDFMNAERRRLSLRAKVAVVLGIGFRLNMLRRFAWSKRQEMFKARSYREARQIVRAFRQEDRERSRDK